MFGSPDETYGKDVNTIVRAIMGADERPRKVKDLFEAFYGAMDRQDLTEAEKILIQLEKILGSGDEELASCGNRVCGDKKNMTCDAKRGNAVLTVNPRKPETVNQNTLA